MEQKRENLKISGAGSCGGGIYDEVKISGAGTITGDIDCNLLKVSGAARLKGNVKAKEIKSSGSSSVNGDVETGSIEISGSSNIKGSVTAEYAKISGGSDIEGDLKVGKLKISGGSDIKGNLYGDEVNISGGIKIEKDCECEKFNATGSFKINGLLNADEVEVELYGRCKVREIGGRNINIRISSTHGGAITQFIKSMFIGDRELITDSVEGDDIFLEATKAKIVRGKNVTIGKDCEIEKVEYSGELSVIDGGRVQDEVKI